MSPFTVTFLDGSSVSQLDHPGLSLAEVRPRVSDIETFMLQLDPSLQAAVNLASGHFYWGPHWQRSDGWFPGPHSVGLPPRRLYFARGCVATCGNGKLKTEVREYALGFTAAHFSQVMVIDPVKLEFHWR